QTGDREACVLGVQRGRGPVGRDRPPDKPEPAGGGGPPTGVPGSGTWGGSEAGESTSRRLYCALAHPKQCEGRIVDLQEPAGGEACDGAPARAQAAGNICAAGGPAHRQSEGVGATRRRVPATTVPDSRRRPPAKRRNTKEGWSSGHRVRVSAGPSEAATLLCAGGWGGASLEEAHPGPAWGDFYCFISFTYLLVFTHPLFLPHKHGHF